MTAQDLEAFHAFSKAVARLEDRINLLMKENQELNKANKELNIANLQLEAEYNMLQDLLPDSDQKFAKEIKELSNNPIPNDF